MKVFLGQEYLGLRKRVEVEGDVVVPSPSTDSVSLVHRVCQIPNTVISSLGYTPGQGEPTHALVRWWNKQWHPQTAIVIPFLKLLDGDLGPSAHAGCSMRFTTRQSHYFERPQTEALLDEWKYRGFVSLILHEDSVLWMETGAAFGSLYNLAEAMKGRVSDWFRDPGRLYESWSTSLLISRWPWPGQGQWEKTPISDPLRNLYPLDCEHYRSMWYSTGGRVGVVVNWSDTVQDAGQRAIWSAEKIKIPSVVYRRDGVEYTRERWGRLEELGLT